MGAVSRNSRTAVGLAGLAVFTLLIFLLAGRSEESPEGARDRGAEEVARTTGSPTAVLHGAPRQSPPEQADQPEEGGAAPSA